MLSLCSAPPESLVNPLTYFICIPCHSWLYEVANLILSYIRISLTYHKYKGEDLPSQLRRYCVVFVLYTGNTQNKVRTETSMLRMLYLLLLSRYLSIGFANVLVDKSLSLLPGARL